jgi:hypothetical protein
MIRELVGQLGGHLEMQVPVPPSGKQSPGRGGMLIDSRDDVDAVKSKPQVYW